MSRVPVLFIVFNRPDTTSMVLDRILAAKPQKLYVAGDGPNNFMNEAFVEATRKLVLDKTKSIKTEYLWRDKNLGCKKGVIGAINWFFENEEEGIILEDDCLPDSSFFQYCEKALEFYRENPKVMHISGSNLQITGGGAHESVYFSRLPNIWGWATWKRAWSLYDPEMKRFKEFSTGKYLDDIIKDKALRARYIKLYKKIYNGVDTWDFQWTYSNIIYGGISVIPNFNLISNIGFGNRATHSIDPNNPLANLPLESFDFKGFPNHLNIDRKAESRFLEITNSLPPIHLRIINKAKKLKNLILNSK